MNDIRLNYYILIPAWGERYVARALDYCLASLLSKNNIPAVVANDRVTVLFLIRESSRRFFENNPVYCAAQRLAAIEFLSIDDLVIPQAYGVTLTLAYARAILRFQEVTPTPVFLFANADFVYSDGALAYIGQKVCSGFDGIACPSVRCVEDKVLGRLDTQRKADGALDLSCAFLIRQVYDFPHMTDLASTLGTGLLFHTNPNHFYIGDRKERLLGFWYLRLPLAIRPVIKFDRVHCFCDYSFMVQMVPEERIYRPTDGHEIFILELSDADQESNHVRFGQVPLAETVRRLQDFTTVHHRENGRFPYLIDVEPSEEGRTGLMRAFRETQAQIESLYTASPYDWRDHPYWRSALLYLKSQGNPAIESLFESRTLVENAPSEAQVWTLRVRLFFMLFMHTARHVFRSVARYMFHTFFSAYVPCMAEIRKMLEGTKVILVSDLIVAEYISSFYGQNISILRNVTEFRGCVSDLNRESQSLLFIGQVGSYLEICRILEAQPRTSAKIALALVVIPSDITNRQAHQLIERQTNESRTQDSVFVPGGDVFLKAELLLHIWNRKSGFSLVTRVSLVCIFVLGRLVENLSGRLRRGRRTPDHWTIMRLRGAHRYTEDET